MLGSLGIGGLPGSGSAHYPAHRLFRGHRPRQQPNVCVAAYAFLYLGWVVSAFVTFLPDRDRTTSHKRKPMRRRRTCSMKKVTKEKRRRWFAMAPPRVGRARLRRRRPVVGIWRAIALEPLPGHRGDYASDSTRPAPPRRATRGRCIARRPAPPSPHPEDAPGSSSLASNGLSAAEACSASCGSLRVGEATNPGHPRLLNWVSALASSALAYADPNKMGFHGAYSPGFDIRDQEPPAEPFALTIVTANTTGWRPLQRLLCRTNAHVVFAQEHRLRADDIAAASAWARRSGWKTIWAPAVDGAGGGAAGGTVVCARSFMGLRHPDRGGSVVCEGRAVAAIVEPPSCRPFVGYSAYFHDGQGLSRSNVELAAAVGAHWQAQETDALQMILAADFNMEPAAFAKAGLAEKVWGRLVVPRTPRGTCRTRTKASTFDYFFMTAAMADLVSEVSSWEGSGIRTHSPTVAVFYPRLASLKALAIRAPPTIPVDAVFGPRPPPPDWRGPVKAAEQLVDYIRAGGPVEQADQLLADVYGIWLNRAEEELADATGTKLPRSGCRAAGPRLRWRSILPEVSRTPPPTGASILAWAADIVRDAARLPPRQRDADEVPQRDLVTMLTEAIDEDVDGRHLLDSDGTLERLRGLLGEAARLMDQGTHTGMTAWQEWDGRREHLLLDLRARLASAAAGETTTAIKEWRDWIRRGFEAGARNAHAYLRLPPEWRPSTANSPSGIPTASPAQLLETQRDKYAQAWLADSDCGHYLWPSRQALPRLSASELREASRLFKKRTAVAYDGIHCRHYSLLCDGALEALGAILEACELLGNLPRQARLVVTPLLEKPKGGFRPIAIYVSLYRLWAKARRDVAARWEASNARPFFSSSRGNGPLDTTWRQGVRQEARVSSGGASACVMWDLESFYESVDRERLLRRAEATDFPLPVVRLSLAMYAAPRVLSMEGRIARELWPKRGVGAGCGLANSYVKVYTLPPLDDLTPKLPSTVTVDLHIDDFVIEVVADDERTAARDLLTAVRMVREMIEKELGATISTPKAALVASSKSLATTLRDSIGALAGPVRQAAPNLGVDSSAAKRRGARGTDHLRRARWHNARKKKQRLRNLADIVGTKAGRVFTVGVASSAAYHAAVQGLTDQEATKLRRLAAVVYPPRSRYRSLTLTHLYHGMPTAAVEIAATMHYSRAVWAATLLGGARPRHAGFDLPGLRASWDAVASRASDFLLKDHPDPSKRRRWGRTRGPIAAALLELHRAGWRADAPFEWYDDQECKVILTETPPALLKHMLCASIRRQAERTMGAKWAARDPQFMGKRLCIDAAVDALNRSRTLTPLQKGAFRSSLLGGVLTKTKAAKCGYVTDGLCEHCGELGDDIYHRTFKCKGTEDAVRAVVPDWFWAEAQRASPSDLFWTTASMPHPADMVPQPRDDYMSWVFDGDGNRCSDPHMHGHIFIDGSCSTSVFRGLQRAALALVQLGDDALPIKTVSVPVWCTLPQSSQAAEYAAFAALPQVLDAEAVAYGDCQGVLDRAALDPERRFEGRRKYSGVLRSMLKYPTGTSCIKQAVKVKAHQCIEGITDDHERWKAKGNKLADEAAKAARARHPQPTKEAEAQIAFWEKRARHVVEAVATAMALFSPLGGKLVRRRDAATTAAGPARAPAAPKHDWEYTAGRWRCSSCWTYVAGNGAVPPARRREACQPSRDSDRLRQFESRGHTMLRTEGDLPIMFCVRCGSWTSRRANRLAKPCEPPTAAGKMALKRISEGLHPWRGRGAHTSKELPRGRLAIKGRQLHYTRRPGAKSSRAPLSQAPCADAEASAKKQKTDHPRPTPADDQYSHAYGGPATLDLDGPPIDSDEDVFGHGGCLDQLPPVEPRGLKRPRHQQPHECEERETTVTSPPSKLHRRPRCEAVMQQLQGTSMHMLLSALRNTPAHFEADHIVPIFNSGQGTFIKVTLQEVQAEVSRLRSMGVRDDDQGDQAEPGSDAASRRPPQSEDAYVGIAMHAAPATESEGIAERDFTSRAELIRHLTSGSAASGLGNDTTTVNSAKADTALHPAAAEDLRGRPRARNLFDVDVAVARSTAKCAAGTREGPGGPGREAGAAAAVALCHHGAGATAAVTAEREVVLLSSEHLTTAGPPHGRAAPWDGYKNAKGTTRPECTTPQTWPTRPVAGTGRPSLSSLRRRPERPVAGAGIRHELSDENGQCQPGDERRREGAGEPLACASVARCGADATGPGKGKVPSQGTARGVHDARNEWVDQEARRQGPATTGCDDDAGRDMETEELPCAQTTPRDPGPTVCPPWTKTEPKMKDANVARRPPVTSHHLLDARASGRPAVERDQAPVPLPARRHGALPDSHLHHPVARLRDEHPGPRGPGGHHRPIHPRPQDARPLRPPLPGPDHGVRQHCAFTDNGTACCPRGNAAASSPTPGRGEYSRIRSPSPTPADAAGQADQGGHPELANHQSEAVLEMPTRAPAAADPLLDVARSDQAVDGTRQRDAAQQDHLHRHPLPPSVHQGSHRPRGPPVQGGPHRGVPPPGLLHPPPDRPRQCVLHRGEALREDIPQALSHRQPPAETADVQAGRQHAAEPWAPYCGDAAAPVGTERPHGAAHRAASHADHLDQEEYVARPADHAREQIATRGERLATQIGGCQPVEAGAPPPPTQDYSVTSAPARRRITGKRRPLMMLAAQRSGHHLHPATCLAVGCTEGPANSPPEGKGAWTAAVGAVCGLPPGPHGEARFRGESGSKRIRLGDECREPSAIGIGEPSPAHAWGELNTVTKSTSNSRIGLEAAGRAAVEDLSAAAASTSPPPERPRT